MAPTIIFQHSTKTLRQFPQNYLLAHFDENHRYWIADTDGAADMALATKVFQSLFIFDNKYERNGYALADRINGKFTIQTQ